MEKFLSDIVSVPSSLMAVLAVVLTLVLLAVTWVRGGASPKARRKKVASALKGYARLRGYRVLNDVVLDSGGEKLMADHILVGHFGLLVVSDLVLPGDYYAQLTDKTWVCNTPVKEKEASVRLGSYANPLNHNAACIEAIRAIFVKNSVYNVQIDSLVVVAWTRYQIFITGAKDKVITLRSLRDFLGKARYGADNGLDVEKVAGLLSVPSAE